MHTILFDIDGTLLSTQNAGSRTIDRVLSDVFQIQRAIPLRLHGRTDRGILNELLQGHNLPSDDHSFQAFQAAYLPLLDAHLGQYPSTVLPGVPMLLEWLSRRTDVAVGILTGNMREGAKLKLKHSGLQQHFRFGGYGDRHPLRDDVARDAWSAAKAHLQDQFRPDRVWVIGDTVSDVTCARAIQAKSIAVLTGGSSAEELANCKPHFLLDNLDNAIDLFQQHLGDSHDL